MTIDFKRELQKTCPDFVVYVPKSADGSSGDTGNEHFLVFEGPDDELMAVWTQSTFEGEADQRIVFSRAAKGRLEWSPPKIIAGPTSKQKMASWGFPMVSRSGRIYVIYSRHIGVNDLWTHTTGLMAGIWSDDGGITWSEEQFIRMPRTVWDNPEQSIPANWVIWQKPVRISDDRYFVGMTRWVSPAVRPPQPTAEWWSAASVVEFLRFENIDDNPSVEDIIITWLAANDEAVKVSFPKHPEVSVAQEPSIVTLPDGRFFCVVRTATGNPYCTMSPDAGNSWSSPQPLRQTDHTYPFRHPCSPCPIYQIAEGEYIFLFHNHDGHFGGWGPADSQMHRRPIYLCRGLFRPDARQPLWFSEPQFFMDHGGVSIRRGDLAMYASVTPSDDGLVLWYPDRKFFLLGKHIRRSALAAISVPE